ncbi:MAG: hypothetical protein JWR68_16 [Polaromonas sp.]|nr:hypothetical protein [Polaromonas sp.]
MKNFSGLLLVIFAMGNSLAAQIDLPVEETYNTDVERKMISSERERLDARFTNENADCYKKFAVNSCLGKVNSQRRDAMAEFRRQEILLNDKERKAKGIAQLRSTEQKSSIDKKLEVENRHTLAKQDYLMRMEDEKRKQHKNAVSISNRNNAEKVTAERVLRQQEKMQAADEKKDAAGEALKNLNERQKKAQERKAQHWADQLKRDKPLAKPLPLPEN